MAELIPQQQEEHKSSIGLKRLRKPHYEMIALRSLGLTTKEIADKTGYNSYYVSEFLREPVVKSMLNQLFDEEEERLRSMTVLSVNAIRDGLDEQKSDIGTRLKAAKMQLESQGLNRPKDSGGGSAEDVIQRMLNIQVNVNTGEQK